VPLPTTSRSREPRHTRVSITHIVISADPNGTIGGVELLPMGLDHLPQDHSIESHRTVWQCITPTTTEAFEEFGPYNAARIFDLAYSSEYRSQDPDQWDTGEATRQAFYTGEEYTALRTVEAHLVLAGHTEARIGAVGPAQWGVLLDHEGETFAVARTAGGWEYIWFDSVQPPDIEVTAVDVPQASAQAVAEAFLAHLAATL